MNCRTFSHLLLGLAMLLVTGTSMAQNAEFKWGLGFHGALVESKTSLGDNFFSFKVNDKTFGQGISINRYLNKSFDLGLFLLHGAMSQKKDPYFMDDLVYTADLRLRYKLYNGYIFNEDACIGPYLTAGIGGAFGDVEANGPKEKIDDNMVAGLDIYAGAGIRFRLSDQVSLDWQTGLHMPSDNKWDANEDGDKDQFLEHSLGVIVNLGVAKDSDGDGVSDKNDKCPNTPAGVKVDEAGCPLDGDKDGVADYLDDCPAVPGVAALKGCPDKDNDGVADRDDRCPDVPGLMTLQGCPDADGDGVADLDDKCPDTKAGYKVNETGCPMDSDGDGVVNEEDDCPTVKGAAFLKGCPDGDSDGIADKDDKCPTVAGVASNKGCPEIPKEIITQITKIASKIFFETGSDKLKSASKTQLDDLSDILKKYPEAKLSIEGHTDNTGDAQKNMVLSQKRCESVKNYLASKGIDPERMKATGYGDTRPVADNKTSEGRAKNRRVELKTEY